MIPHLEANVYRRDMRAEGITMAGEASISRYPPGWMDATPCSLVFPNVRGMSEFTRRRFIIGTVGVGAAAALARGGGGLVPRALAAGAPSGPPTTTLPLPTTTEPEQLLLTWGSDPASEVTVSWSAPGTVPQPAPVLAYSARPITAANPGRLIKLPDPSPLDVTRRYDEAAAVSFTDGLNGQTTYFYHVQLTRPGAGNAVLLPGQRRRGRPVHRGRLVRDGAVGAREVPLLQLRRPVDAFLGPQHVGEHLARVL